MNPEKKNYKLYRNIYPSSAPETASIIFVSVISAAIALFMIYGIYITVSAGDLATAAVITIICCFFAGLLLFWGIKDIKNTKLLNNKRRKIADNTDISVFERLEEEIQNTEFSYKTFYMLEDYLYVPGAKLLIKYEDINFYRNIVHSTNGIKDGIRTEITDEDGLVFAFRVVKWRAYLKEMNEFTQHLEVMLNKNKKYPQNQRYYF